MADLHICVSLELRFQYFCAEIMESRHDSSSTSILINTSIDLME